MVEVTSEYESIPDEELAEYLFRRWKEGAAKSRLEREVWNDGASHGKRFDRFMIKFLGVDPVKMRKRSRGLQLQMPMQSRLIPDAEDREHATELLGDISGSLAAIADDPTTTDETVVVIEQIILPQLSELSTLIQEAIESDDERQSKLSRAKELTESLTTVCQMVGVLSRNLGIGSAGFVTALAQAEPAVRGVKFLIDIAS